MTDKTKLKTRAPSTQFLEDTRPPEFVPRARAKKSRAWYRPEDDEAETVEVAEAISPPVPTPVLKAAESPAPQPIVEPIAAVAALSPEATQKTVPQKQEEPQKPSAKSKHLAEAAATTVTAPQSSGQTKAKRPEVSDSGTLQTHAQTQSILAKEPDSAPQLNIQTRQEPKTAAVIESAQPANRQGASAQAPNLTDNQDQFETTESETLILAAAQFSDRAKALIARAKNGCPHEYLFRQILMFEMSTHDASGEFGTLALSRNALEQLFGISEGGVKKAKREMEAHKLIATVSLGTRGSPTVFKIFSPYSHDTKKL